MTLQRVRVTWPPASLLADFAAYRISRDGELVARLTTRAAGAWLDYEGRRGVPATYTVQVERTDGSYSTIAATPAAIPYALDCAWAFASNVAPELSVEFQATAERRYTFRSDRSTRRLYGRSNVAEFVGLEDRGDEFPLQVVRWQGDESGDLAGLADRELYDALVAIASADLPYVAVLNPYGRRWFASIDVQQGEQTLGDTLGIATVQVSEVSERPWVVEA